MRYLLKIYFLGFVSIIFFLLVGCATASVAEQAMEPDNGEANASTVAAVTLSPITHYIH